MSHGSRDWSSYGLKSTVHNLQDLAELAARLGSINTFDRRGDVIWMDDFEDNINKWQQSASAHGGSIALSSDTARNGGKSAKLVTGNVNGDVSQISIIRPAVPGSGIGAEVSWNFHYDVEPFELHLFWYTGTRAYIGQFRVWDLTGNVDVYDKTLGWVTILTQGLLPANLGAFLTCKMVIDPTTGKYKRLIFGGTEIDLSAYTLYTSSSTNTPQIICVILANTTADIAGTCYVDDFILTQNEP